MAKTTRERLDILIADMLILGWIVESSTIGAKWNVVRYCEGQAPSFKFELSNEHIFIHLFRAWRKQKDRWEEVVKGEDWLREQVYASKCTLRNYKKSLKRTVTFDNQKPEQLPLFNM